MAGEKMVSKLVDSPAGAILLAALLWGSSFPTIKFGIDYLDAYHFVFLRFLFGTLLLTFFLKLQGKSFPWELLKNRLVLILGVSNAAGFFLQFAGMTLTSAINTSLLVNSNFVLVILFSAWHFREKLTWKVGLALVLSELGVLLLVTGGDPGTLESSSFLGDVLVFLAGIAWVVYIVVNKKAVTESQTGRGPGAGPLDVLELMTAVFFLTMVFVAPFSLYFGGATLSSEPLGWAAVLYVSVFCTGLPFLLYSHGLKEVSAGASALMLLLEVVVAAVISVAFLEERLGLANLVGAVLILLGIAMVGLKKNVKESSSELEK